MAGYYPINLPRGVVRNGMVYGPLSPTDVKAKTNKRALLLVDEHGYETELALCQSTKEFKDSNFLQSSEKLDSYRSSFIDELFQNNAEPITGNYIDLLVDQLLTLQQVFSEDFLNKRPEQDDIHAMQEKGKHVKDLLAANAFIDPRLHIMRPFETLCLDDLKGGWHDHNDAADLYKERFGKHELDDGLKPLKDSICSFNEQYVNNNLLRYTSMSDDLVSRLLSCFGDQTLLYSSWNENRPIWLMHRSDEPADRSIMLDNERYVCDTRLKRVDFELAMHLLTQAAIINDIPVMHGQDSSPARLLFPVDLANGKISIEHDWTLVAKLSFPPYAVVDISNQSYVFLMPGGETKFKYHLSLRNPSKLLSAEVYGDEGQDYYHFFTSKGKVCGFRDSINNATLDRLSTMIWENYQLMLSVLTDGLKHDSGWVKIPTMQKAVNNVPITIGDVTFPSRYLRREKITDYNKHALQPLHIGDGRAS